MPDGSHRYIKIFFFLLLLTAAGFFVYTIGEIVRLLIIAALLAYILDPIATGLESRGLNRLGATAIVFLGIGVALYMLASFVMPALVREIQNLQASGSMSQTSVIVSDLEKFINQKLVFLGMQEIDLAAKIEEAKRGVSEQLLGQLVTGVVPFVTQAVAIPFIIFFLLKDGRGMMKTLLSMVPNRYFEFSLNLIYKMDLHLGAYLRGQFLDALIFGILSTLAMWILNVKYFFFVGVFAGLANLIPYVGPLAGGALACVITVLTTGDLSRVLYVVLAFAGAKLVDDSIVQPLVVAKSVDMHPLVVLIVVIVGGQFFGIMGMLLSVPFAGFAKVVIEESGRMIRRYKLAL